MKQRKEEVMIQPDKVKTEDKKKEDENFKFQLFERSCGRNGIRQAVFTIT